MKTERYSLQCPLGWLCYFDMKRGPLLTQNKHLRYVWDTEEQAEAQRYLYEHALKTPLKVVKSENA